MCCTLETFGYDTPNKQTLVQVTSNIAALAAIAGVAMGVLALYNVVSPSVALWTQVGLFGGVAALAGVTVGFSKHVKSKLPVVMAVITLLALPVLFGSLGAIGAIPPYNMLWAATSMSAAVVLGAFTISMCSIAKDCCTQVGEEIEDQYSNPIAK